VWWLVSFTWTGTTWSYAGIQDSPGDIFVNDISNNRKTIQRLEPYKAHETLGVFLAPDGNLDDQFQKMQAAAVKWADNLRTGSISRNEAWIALQSTILRTLAYPLPALRLTKDQCAAIMAPILRYCLPALGICRNFPRKLVFLTLDYMGLNLQHLYILQEIVRIKDIILHCFNDTFFGKLYRTSLELFVIELGMNYTPPSMTVIKLLTTPTLIQSTMIFLLTHDFKLIHSISINPLRQNDQLIMEALVSLDVPLPDLLACNHCRLYLKVCRLSELTTSDGIFLSEDAWNGIVSAAPNTELAWPTYPRPSAVAWTKWRWWISKGQRLRQPLRKWLKWDDN
jgi:hypothetical protein